MSRVRVVVTGGRHYDQRKTVYRALDALLDRLREYGRDLELIQGGADGADRLARDWATRRAIEWRTIPAEWKKYGPRAGPIRNQAMIDMQPNLVVAFPGGSGTEDCVNRAYKAKIRIEYVK